MTVRVISSSSSRIPAGQVERAPLLPERRMDYDKILEHTGEKGWWHTLNVLLLWLPPMAAGVYVLQTSFSRMKIYILT